MMTTEQGNMTDSIPKKFMFDTQFEIEEPEPEVLAEPEAQEPEAEDVEVIAEPEFVEEIAPTFSEEELAQARAEGLQAGREEAIKDMTSALEQQMANALNIINEQVERLFDAYASDTEEHARNAIAVASVIVRKLFPTLNADHAMGEIESIIIEAMQRTSGAPSLLIKVPADIHKDIEAKVNEMAALRGREGKISVMADIDMPDGDLLVEWAGGGISRDTSLMWEQIDEIVERNLGSTIEEVTEKNSLPPKPEAESTHAENQELAHKPEQEVVKQDVVGENTEVTAESPQDAATPPEAPMNDGVQPNKMEPED